MAKTNEHAEALFGLGVNSTNRLSVLLDRVANAEGDIFWPVFLAGWTSCDATWPYRKRLLAALRRNKGVDWRHHARPDALGFHDRLPDVVTVYRGGTSRRVRYGLSWTTDRKVAEKFARGHRFIPVPYPAVACARVPKTSIFAVFTDRAEDEVLVDPRHLTGILQVDPRNPWYRAAGEAWQEVGASR